ncbi:butyrophilin-like protein 1 [Erpetoichthys calabaricus]|uniref:butyrophilin-like protein 1 n=1 Tax=Erpetoichthys calabaricus TaxID=27687 RepID=UPI002234B763|nr:butyrophilin-like protein 1 [Erpetoichthys calabaricus]
MFPMDNFLIFSSVVLLSFCNYLVYATDPETEGPIAMCQCSFSTNGNGTSKKLNMKWEKVDGLPSETLLVYPDKRIQVPSFNCSYMEGSDCLIEKLEKTNISLRLKCVKTDHHEKNIGTEKETLADRLGKDNMKVDQVDIQVTVNKTVVAELSYDTVILCSFSGTVELQNSAVYWMRKYPTKSVTVMAYENGLRQPAKENSAYLSRTQLIFDNTTGDASLLLKSVNLADSGVYVCQVGNLKTNKSAEGWMNLTVTASSRTMIVKGIQNHSLTVISNSWYPTVTIQWLDSNGTDITNKSHSEITCNGTMDGLCQIISSYPLDDVHNMDFCISCINPYSYKSTSVIFKYRGPDIEMATKWIGISGLLGALLGGLLGALLYFLQRRCSKKDTQEHELQSECGSLISGQRRDSMEDLRVNM